MDTRFSWAEGDKRTEDTKQQQTTSSDQLAHHAPAQLPPPFDITGQLSHPHLKADPPSEQQVHSKVSLRRAVDAVQR
jgi:hypothetical protein